jgi:hypothetical protein
MRAVDRGACANCGVTLTGEFCAQCGQHARDLHRPIGALLSEAAGEIFSFDTRFLRTLKSLLFRPGQVTRDYLSGKRAAYVSPVKTYLVAALIFFGLFTLFPQATTARVFVAGSPEAANAKSTGGTGTTVELPTHMPIADAWYQAASRRAMERPDDFILAIYRNIPRAFFFFLPMFALLLELFYRKQGYYIDHLVFSLYYHAFAFLALAARFLIGRSGSWLPDGVATPARMLLLIWVFAYLPLALRRVYGGTWMKTGLKVAALSVLYLVTFIFVAMGVMTWVTLLTF